MSRPATRPDQPATDTRPGPARLGRADHGHADLHPPARRGRRRSRGAGGRGRRPSGSCARWTRSSRPTATDSDLMRLRREEVSSSQCSPLVEEALRIGQEAEVLTRGAFTTLLPTGDGDLAFDPTGLVKGWAVDRASVPLLALERISFCINAGGDILIGAHPTMPTDGPRTRSSWRVGVEDPLDRQRIASTLTLARGAVATSGTAARGAHLYDPGSRGARRPPGVGDGDRTDPALGRHLGDGALRRFGAHERGLRHECDRLPLDGPLTAPPGRGRAPGRGQKPQVIPNREGLAAFLRKPSAARRSGLAVGAAESSSSAGTVGGPAADTETFGRVPADPGRGAP